MRSGLYVLSEPGTWTTRRKRLHLGITPGGQRTVCKIENNVGGMKLIDRRPRNLLEIFKEHPERICKLCLKIATKGLGRGVQELDGRAP